MVWLWEGKQTNGFLVPLTLHNVYNLTLDDHGLCLIGNFKRLCGSWSEDVCTRRPVTTVQEWWQHLLFVHPRWWSTAFRNGKVNHGKDRSGIYKFRSFWEDFIYFILVCVIFFDFLDIFNHFTSWGCLGCSNVSSSSSYATIVLHKACLRSRNLIKHWFV